MAETKSFCISKRAVWDAWLKVKANQGAAGADEESILGFEKRLKLNLPVLCRLAVASVFGLLGRSSLTCGRSTGPAVPLALGAGTSVGCSTRAVRICSSNPAFCSAISSSGSTVKAH